MWVGAYLYVCAYVCYVKPKFPAYSILMVQRIYIGCSDPALVFYLYT